MWKLRIEEYFPDADVPKELLKPHEQPEQPEPEAPEAPEAEVPEETEAEPPAKAEVDTPQVGRWLFATKHGRISCSKTFWYDFGMILYVVSCGFIFQSCLRNFHLYLH